MRFEIQPGFGLILSSINNLMFWNDTLFYYQRHAVKYESIVAVKYYCMIYCSIWLHKFSNAYTQPYVKIKIFYCSLNYCGKIVQDKHVDYKYENYSKYSRNNLTSLLATKNFNRNKAFIDGEIISYINRSHYNW